MLELEAERLTARVEELEREKAALEAFAAVAAHELVEPLVMTEAYVAIVTDRLDADLHADSRRDLATISRAASRTVIPFGALQALKKSIAVPINRNDFFTVNTLFLST